MGFQEEACANLVADVLDNPNDGPNLALMDAEVAGRPAHFPVYQ